MSIKETQAINDVGNEYETTFDSELETEYQTIEEISTADSSILEEISTKTVEQSQKKPASAELTHYPYQLLGKVVSIYSRYRAMVVFEINGYQYTKDAITTVVLDDNSSHNPCIISFNQGDISQPMIMGIIQSEANDPALAPIALHSDVGISLQCGSSRLELDENGTINIQGMHINSQAYGPHRIKGGSVKIN